MLTPDDINIQDQRSSHAGGQQKKSKHLKGHSGPRVTQVFPSEHAGPRVTQVFPSEHTGPRVTQVFPSEHTGPCVTQVFPLCHTGFWLKHM